MILDIPFFQQEQWWTCGPACLRMVLASLGVDTSEEDLVEICGTDSAGSTCDELAEAAEKLSLEAEVIENLSVRDLRAMLENGTPFIALIDAGVLYHDIAGFGHLVVIVGLEKREVVYHDPERRGFQRAGYSQFWRAWGEFDYLGVKVWKLERK